MVRPKAQTGRNNKGSGIVEGAVGLVLIIFGAVCAVLFMVNSGIAMYQKSRLSYVAMQTATYASQMPRLDQAAVKLFAQDILRQMGIDSGDIGVVATDVTVKGQPAVKVELRNAFPLFNSRVDYLPKTVAISDAAICVKSSGSFGNAVAYIHMLGTGGSPTPRGLFIPVVKEISPGSLPMAYGPSVRGSLPPGPLYLAPIPVVRSAALSGN